MFLGSPGSLSTNRIGMATLSQHCAGQSSTLISLTCIHKGNWNGDVIPTLCWAAFNSAPLYHLFSLHHLTFLTGLSMKTFLVSSFQQSEVHLFVENFRLLFHMGGIVGGLNIRSCQMSIVAYVRNCNVASVKDVRACGTGSKVDDCGRLFMYVHSCDVWKFAVRYFKDSCRVSIHQKVKHW